MCTILNFQYVPKQCKTAYCSAICKCTVYRNKIAWHDHSRDKIYPNDMWIISRRPYTVLYIENCYLLCQSSTSNTIWLLLLFNCTWLQYCGMAASVREIRSATQQRCSPLRCLKVRCWSKRCWWLEERTRNCAIFGRRAIHIQHKFVIKQPPRAPRLLYIYISQLLGMGRVTIPSIDVRRRNVVIYECVPKHVPELAIEN